MLSVIEGTVRSCQPDALLRAVMPKDTSRYKRVSIISIGKAAASMARAAARLLDRKPHQILLADSGHPLPTAEGVLKTKKIIRASEKMGRDDLALVLISGGGSAMLCAPVKEITLADKIHVTKALLRAGAPIHELNCVRTELSEVKGGRLAQLLFPAAIMGFIISDVIGNDLGTIASGPLTPKKNTARDALKVLAKYKITPPRRVTQYLRGRERTPLPAVPVTTRIIADHTTALAAAEKNAQRAGFKTRVVKKLLAGESRETAGRFMDRLPKRGMEMIIAGGETTVTCRGSGYGGRNQEFALAALPLISPRGLLASIGTDGIDGICPEPVAGAMIDSEIRKTAERKKISIKDYLERNDSYTFFKLAGGLIKTGPTGTNLGDLVFYSAG